MNAYQGHSLGVDYYYHSHYVYYPHDYYYCVFYSYSYSFSYLVLLLLFLLLRIHIRKSRHVCDRIDIYTPELKLQYTRTYAYAHVILYLHICL